MKRKASLVTAFFISFSSLYSIPAIKFVSPAEISPVLYPQQGINEQHHAKFQSFLALIKSLNFREAEAFLQKNHKIPGFKLNLALLYYYAGADRSSNEAITSFINLVSEAQATSILKLLSRRGQKAEVIYFCEVASYVPEPCRFNLHDEGKIYPRELELAKIKVFITEVKANKNTGSYLWQVTTFPSGKSWFIKHLLKNGEIDLAKQLYGLWQLGNYHPFNKVVEQHFNSEAKREQSNKILLTVDK